MDLWKALRDAIGYNRVGLCKPWTRLAYHVLTDAGIEVQPMGSADKHYFLLASLQGAVKIEKDDLSGSLARLSQDDLLRHYIKPIEVDTAIGRARFYETPLVLDGTGDQYYKSWQTHGTAMGGYYGPIHRSPLFLRSFYEDSTEWDMQFKVPLYRSDITTVIF